MESSITPKPVASTGRVILVDGSPVGPMDVTIRPLPKKRRPTNAEEKARVSARAVLIACRKLGTMDWRPFDARQFWHGGRDLQVDWLELLRKIEWVEIIDTEPLLYQVTPSFVEFWYDQRTSEGHPSL